MARPRHAHYLADDFARKRSQLIEGSKLFLRCDVILPETPSVWTGIVIGIMSLPLRHGAALSYLRFSSDHCTVDHGVCLLWRAVLCGLAGSGRQSAFAKLLHHAVALRNVFTSRIRSRSSAISTALSVLPRSAQASGALSNGGVPSSEFLIFEA